MFAERPRFVSQTYAATSRSEPVPTSSGWARQPGIRACAGRASHSPARSTVCDGASRSGARVHAKDPGKNRREPSFTACSRSSASSAASSYGIRFPPIHTRSARRYPTAIQSRMRSPMGSPLRNGFSKSSVHTCSLPSVGSPRWRSQIELRAMFDTLPRRVRANSVRPCELCSPTSVTDRKQKRRPR